MGAFERLQGYSAKSPKNSNGVFDTSTTEGAFFSRVHSCGYKLYNEKEDGTVEYTELHDALKSNGNVLINAIAGSGKALKNGTGVLTNKGYVPIESLKQGDFVYGLDGQLHSVLGVFPQGEKEIFTMKFNDGNIIDCSGDHLWTVRDVDGSWVTRTAIELFGRKTSADVNRSFCNYVIPTQECVSFAGADLDSMNYVKGDDIEDYILYGSADTRFHYLRDIIDEFGSYNPSKECYRVDIVSSDHFVFLVESLGLVCDRRKSYINIYPSQKYPMLHKKDMKHFRYSSEYMERKIVEIVRTGKSAEMTCISVNSSDKLFLTEHFIATHNTTFLSLKIIHDIVTGEAVRLQSIPNGTKVQVPDKIWVCTFLRSGAADIEQSVLSWQRKLGYTQSANQVSFSTLDAEFKRCLNAMGVATNIGDAGVLERLFRKAVLSCNITRSGSDLTNEDYSILRSIVTYYRGRLDGKKYQHPSAKDYGLSPSILDLLVRQFETLRKTEGVMDFEEVQELLYKFLYVTPNNNVRDFVADRYNYIYIDEFQDTSQMQYAILKFYARGRLFINQMGDEVDDPCYTGEEKKGKIIAIGDPNQCIYSFKGSDNDIIEHKYDKDFRPSWCTLSVNYRCPSNILNPIVPSIHKNRGVLKQKILPFKEGGEFYAYSFKNYGMMLEQLKKDVQHDMEEGNSVAILCRINFDGMIPAFILEASKKYDFSISGENMTLNTSLAKSLLGVASLFTERSSASVKRSLQFFVNRFEQYALNSLMDTLKMNGMSIWNIPEADLRYSCTPVANLVAAVKPLFVDENGVRDKHKELDALCYVYWVLRTDVFKADTAYAEAARSCIDTILYIIRENNFSSVYDFLEEIDYMNDRLKGRIKRKKAPIQIATVHEFKGKEADSVYIWNDSSGVFPNSKTDISNIDELEEERRVHYIACTRARKKEHIYTLQGKVSMFVAEMNLSFENPVDIQMNLKNKKVV